jgi:hypothetical protein
MYRTPAAAVVDGGALGLRFATIGVDQLGGRSSGKPDLWPSFCGITGFEWRANYPGRDEFVEPAGSAFRFRAWRDKLCDHATMGRDRNAFAGFDTPDVAAQIVLELTDTR